MPEIQSEGGIRISNHTAMDFYNSIKEIPALKGKKFTIKDKIDQDARKFSCIIELDEPLSPLDEGGVQRRVLQLVQCKIIADLPSGFQGATIDDIKLVVKTDHIAHNTHESQMVRVCNLVEKVFRRDDIHVRFENDIFLVYGAAPRDHTAVSGKIKAHTPHAVTNIIDFRSRREWEEHKEPYQKIIEMYPDDIEGVKALKVGKNRTLKLTITTYSALSTEKERSVGEYIEAFAISKILPTMPGFSCNKEDISFCLVGESKDVGTVAIRQQTNAAYAGVDVPSGSSMFSGVGLLFGRLGDLFDRAIDPK